jgi:hypothetical protein
MSSDWQDWHYLFLRTKIALEYADDYMDALNELGEVEVEGMPVQTIDFGDGAACQNGLVLRFPMFGEFAKISAYFDDALRDMDGWAIVDYKHNCFERPAAAMLDMFLKENKERTICQIYLRYNPDSFKDKKSVESLRSDLEHKVGCRPVFHFRNGVVLFTASNEPPKVTFGRCQRFVRNLPGFLFVEPNGDTFSISGRKDDAWERYFEPWEYEPDFDGND